MECLARVWFTWLNLRELREIDQCKDLDLQERNPKFDEKRHQLRERQFIPLYIQGVYIYNNMCIKRPANQLRLAVCPIIYCINIPTGGKLSPDFWLPSNVWTLMWPNVTLNRHI